MLTKPSQPTADIAAAIRHAVYRDLLDMLPVASFDQAMQFAANLRLRATTPQAKSAALTRFLSLRVTPDIDETKTVKQLKMSEIERFFNAKYGERLQHVAGFHRRDETAPFRLIMPRNCALYGYGSKVYHRASVIEHSSLFTHHLSLYLDGILCQPLDRLNSFFLLSSSKFGGAKAVRLSPRDQQYFTQYEEVSV